MKPISAILILLLIFFSGVAAGCYAGLNRGIEIGVARQEEAIRVLNIKWMHERKRRVKAEGGW